MGEIGLHEIRDEVASYLKELEGNRVLSAEEEKEAVEKARKGDKGAIASLIESFAKRAEEMASIRYEGSIPLMDLIQEANRGLYYAAAHLSSMPLDCSFSSFATTIVASRLDAYIKDEEELLEEAEEDNAEALNSSPLLSSPSNSPLPSGEAVFSSEVAKYPLLSKEQERRLGERIQKGLKEGASEEERKEGKEAEDLLIKHNLRLVMSIAKDYLNCGLPYLDLIQEGYFGLQKAARKFDPTLGWRFSTYAYPWIRQAIQRILSEQGRGIKLSQHAITRLSKVRKEFESLTQKLGREPTPAELSEALPDYSPKDIQTILEIPSNVISLDEPINQGEGDSLDLLSTVHSDDDVSEGLDEEDRERLIDKGLSVLNDRERTIITYMFGLEGKEKMDMSELGRKFGISRERVRQIHLTALSKMRKALDEEKGELS